MRTLLACGAAASALSASAPSRAADQASLQLNWLVTGFHSMFYLGKERGCYTDQGIDPTIGEGQGSGRAIQIVAAGSDMFGLADGPSVILGKTRGADVMAVMGAMVSSPYSISMRADRGVKTARDLEGKAIAMTIGEASVPLLQAVWKINSIDKSKVTMLNGS